MDYIQFCPYDFEVIQLGSNPLALSAEKIMPSDFPPARACTIAVDGSGTAYYRVDGGIPELGNGIPFTSAHGIRWIGDINALRNFRVVGSGTGNLVVTYYR